MQRVTRWMLAVAIAFVGVCSIRGDEPAEEQIKDRKGYFPNRNHQVMKGTVIGLLVYDGQPILTLEGRGGPADQLCFSVNNGSYRWVYVPTLDSPQITNLQVPVGEKGEMQMYPALNMASPRSVTPWGVKEKYSLVEIEVNNKQGSPAGDSFVATQMKVLDGSKAYPLKTQEVVDNLKKRYADYLKKNEKAIEDAMTEAGKKALKDTKATGPREKSELMYLTWLPESERIRVQFLNKISDGAYKVTKQGGPGIDKLPPPIPKVGGPNFRPFRPGPIEVKTGTTFGIEFGMAYEVNKKGEVVRIQNLPIEPFQQQINTQVGPGGGPRPLPGGGPRILPVEKE